MNINIKKKLPEIEHYFWVSELYLISNDKLHVTCREIRKNSIVGSYLGRCIV